MRDKIKKYQIAIVIVAVAVIPLIYSYLYLWAFWDPYSNLSKLPIAVVNQDAGAVINGEPANIGAQVTERLHGNDQVKWVFTTKDEARNGLDNRKYYGEVVFPENFSQEIASIDSADKIPGTFTYRINEKRNFLAGQITNSVATTLKEEISTSVTAEVLAELESQITAFPDKLGKLDSGLGQLDAGAVLLTDKMALVVNGQKELDNGAQSLSGGMTKLSAGSTALAGGADQLGQGAQQLTGGIQQLNEKLPTLAAGAATLTDGANQLQNGVKQFTDSTLSYVAGTEQLLSTQGLVGNAIGAYVAAHQEALADPNMQFVVKTLTRGKDGAAVLKAGGDSLKTAGEQLNAGATKVTDGATALQSGVNAGVSGAQALAAGANELVAGVGRVQTGATELNTGIGQAQQGSTALQVGSAKLLSGEEQLLLGQQKLQAGINVAQAGVSESLTQLNEKTKNLPGLSAAASAPVKLEKQELNPVPDYGTAFTPYFVSLSLWVGALMLFFAIYLDPRVKFQRSKSQSKGVLRFFAYTLIGVAQAAIVAFALLHGLHLSVKSVPLFYLSCLVIGLAFVSIMRFLIVHLGEVGKFLAILFLILQLTSCGGLFPMELVPQFFRDIGSYMPMTYSLNLLKEVISGIDYAYYWYNFKVLVAIIVAFTAINTAVGILRKRYYQKNQSAWLTGGRLVGATA